MRVSFGFVVFCIWGIVLRVRVRGERSILLYFLWRCGLVGVFLWDVNGGLGFGKFVELAFGVRGDLRTWVKWWFWGWRSIFCGGVGWLGYFWGFQNLLSDFENFDFWRS